MKRCHACGRKINWSNLATTLVGGIDPDSEGIRALAIGCWTCSAQDGPR